MVYLAKLSVCVTVRFKIVRIYARSVPRIHRQALRRQCYCW